MGKKQTPRYLIIVLILLWATSTLLPTWRYQRLSENQKEELRKSGELEKLESKIVRQGLDLKGGMYIVLEADIPTLIYNLSSLKDERLNKIIEKTRKESINPNVDFFTIFENEVKNDGIKLSRYYHEYGASLDGILSELRIESDDAINRVLEILQNRVDQFGVSEPTIQKYGANRIIVELAGINDPNRARNLIQRTASLEFALVLNNKWELVLDKLDSFLLGDMSMVDSLYGSFEFLESKDSVIKDSEDIFIDLKYFPQ